MPEDMPHEPVEQDPHRAAEARTTLASSLVPTNLDGDTLLDAALRVIARDGWPRANFAAIAREGSVDLASVYAAFPERAAIVRAMMRRADRAVLAASKPASDGGGESPRDRLFDVLMRRFDALEPMKPALRAMIAPRADPVAALVVLAALPQSMGWMMEAAGLSPGGLGGRLQQHGLCLLYAAVFRVWLGDEGVDLDKTMRALDQALRRAEPFAAWAERLR
jgi:AcrR family transcriptional regulator